MAICEPTRMDAQSVDVEEVIELSDKTGESLYIYTRVIPVNHISGLCVVCILDTQIWGRNANEIRHTFFLSVFAMHLNETAYCFCNHAAEKWVS